jgi:transposase
MAQVAAHLNVEDLEARYVASRDARTVRHLHAIWLLAKGHTVAEVSEMTAFGMRWIEQLLARYNAERPDALGDLRRGNGAVATVLTPVLLGKLRDRLREPPSDGGIWSSRKVAQWMAGELGVMRVAPQRGWEALKAVGWSIQAPRPCNPKAASPEEAEAFKKSWPMPSPRRRPGIRSARSKRLPRTSIGSA